MGCGSSKIAVSNNIPRRFESSIKKLDKAIDKFNKKLITSEYLIECCMSISSIDEECDWKSKAELFSKLIEIFSLLHFESNFLLEHRKKYIMNIWQINFQEKMLSQIFGVKSINQLRMDYNFNSQKFLNIDGEKVFYCKELKKANKIIWIRKFKAYKITRFLELILRSPWLYQVHMNEEFWNKFFTLVYGNKVIINSFGISKTQYIILNKY